MKPATPLILLFPLLSLLAVSAATAATHTWKGSAGSTLWSTGANWTSGVAPTAGESWVKLIFPATAFQNSTDDVVGLKVDSITVNGGNYVFSGQGGATLTLTGGGGDSFINQPGTGNTTTIAASLPVVLSGLLVTFPNLSGDLAINSVVSGAGIFVRSGVGSVTFGGTAANTFTGGLYCNSGVTLLVKPNGVKALGGGDISIGDPGGVLGAYLTVSHSDQIPDTSPVSIGPKGELILSDSIVDRIGALSIKGGLVQIGWNSATTRLTLGGNVTIPGIYADSNIMGPGMLDMGGQTRTFNVASGVPPDSPLFGNYGLRVFARIVQGSATAGMIKTGNGLFIVAGSNAFSGPTMVNEGILRANNLSSMGDTLAGTTVAPGATLQFDLSGISTDEPVTLQGGGRLFARTDGFLLGPVQVSGLNEIGCVTGSTLTLSGVLSGNGALVASPIHQGVLQISGIPTNTFTGTILLQAGTLSLSKTTGPATKGTLSVMATDPAHPAKVLYESANQISDQSSVVLGEGPANEIDLAGFSDTIGSLAGGGSVKLGGGTLTLGGNQETTEFHGVISGSGGCKLIKNGTGTFTINPALIDGLPVSSSYPGQTILNEGNLVINDEQTGSFLINSAGTLSGTGSVGHISVTSNGHLDLSHLKAQGLIGSGAGNHVSATLDGEETFEHLAITGLVSLNGTGLSVSLTYLPFSASTYVLIENDGTDAVQGTFAGLPEGAALTIGGKPFKITYHGGDGNDVMLIFTGTGLTRARITAISVNAALDTVNLQATGTPGLNYVWQKSTDLKNWSDLSIGTPNAQGIFTATFPTGPGKPARQFYRLVMP